MPEITALLLRAGPGMAAAMGDVPLTAQELAAWLHGVRVSVTPWEFETILELSHAYVQQRIAAASPDCPAPWVTPLSVAQLNRPKIAKRIKNLLRS